MTTLLKRVKKEDRRIEVVALALQYENYKEQNANINPRPEDLSLRQRYLRIRKKDKIKQFGEEDLISSPLLFLLIITLKSL